MAADMSSTNNVIKEKNQILTVTTIS